MSSQEQVERAERHLEQAVRVRDGRVVTTSRAVAEAFGKQHKNVLRIIQDLDFSLEFNRLNFAPVDYLDKKGERQPLYEISKDGFVLLVMGFTGPRAAQFKIAYIEAFNAMERRLQQDYPALIEAMHAELLRANPLWARLVRYQRLGLSGREIARLLGIGETTVRAHKARLARLGLIDDRPDQAHRLMR